MTSPPVPRIYVEVDEDFAKAGQTPDWHRTEVVIKGVQEVNVKEGWAWVYTKSGLIKIEGAEFQLLHMVNEYDS